METDVSIMDFNITNVNMTNDLDEYIYPYNCTYLLGEENYTEYNVTNCTLGGLFRGERNTMSIIASVIAQLFYAVTCIVGLCGNTLVIYVVIRFSKMQTTTNMYILNLAIADELFVLGIPPLMITSSLGFWPFGSYMCKVYYIITSLNQFTSSLFLTIMSADRYLAVCHPISAPKFRTPMISKLVSLTAWTISALMIVPVFMYSATFESNGKINCNMFWPETNGVRGEVVFIHYSFALAFGIPLILIIVLYSAVLLKLKSVGPKSKSKAKKKSRQKVTKLVLTVIAVYVVCWLPYWVLQLTLILGEPKMMHSNFMIILFLISSCLSYINSAMNPILYAFLSDNFKKSFMKACSCASRRDANAALKPENSMFPLRHRLSAKTKSRFGGKTDGHSERVSTSQGDYSNNPSTAMTSALSKTNSTIQDDPVSCRNGKVPAGEGLPDLLH